MKKRGKKLLAIMLAASMTLGQSGTLTAAQENAAERIESVTFNAQAEDEPDLLSEEVTSDTQADEEQQGNDDTDQGDNEGGGDTGGDNNGDGDTPGGNDNNPGAIPIVDPINPTPSGEEPTGEKPSGEGTPNGDEGQFTPPEGDTSQNPNNSENGTEPKTSQQEGTETQLDFQTVKNNLESGQTVVLNADIVIPNGQHIDIPANKTSVLNLNKHKISVEGMVCYPSREQ